VVGPLAFAAVVLATSMPVSALLAQHSQLASTSAALARTRAANRVLEQEARALGDPSAVAALARSEYGLVPPGQKAYVILPPPGASPSAVSGSGHVPLGTTPVVPGSAQSRQLLGLGSSPDAPASTRGGSPGRPAAGSRRGSSGGFWARVARTLEFWR
jgi:hypothetical protein